MTDAEVGDRQPVPWRTIWAVIGSVVVTYLAYEMLVEVKRVLILLAVALFFAVVLAPAVDFTQRRGMCAAAWPRPWSCSSASGC